MSVSIISIRRSLGSRGVALELCVHVTALGGGMPKWVQEIWRVPPTGTSTTSGLSAVTSGATEVGPTEREGDESKEETSWETREGEWGESLILFFTKPGWVITSTNSKLLVCIPGTWERENSAIALN